MAGQAEFVVEALLPSEAGLPSALETGAAGFFASFSREAPLAMRLALRAALFCATWVSPLLIARLPPLSRLSPEDRERALAAMGQSRSALLRQLLLLLKANVSFHYGADPKVRAAIGFPA